MGAYTDVNKVKSLFRSIKILADTGNEKTNTVVTIEEVDEFISEVEALMNARLSKCYDMTTVGAESIKILGMVARYKVADIIKGIMELTTANSDKTTQNVTGDWGKKAKMLMDQICPLNNCGECVEKPKVPLPDTDMLLSAPETANRVSGTTGVATFQRGKDNW